MSNNNVTYLEQPLDSSILYGFQDSDFYVHYFSSPDDGSPTDPAMMNLQGRNQWATKYTIPAFRSAQSTLNNGVETKYTANQIEVRCNQHCVITACMICI